ncbi:MAG: integrin alpha, partial [Myxococcales bacterium]|nr:integrin alpha [Myxococcales bacterium]
DPPELAELAVADPPGTKDITVAVANSAECTNAGGRQFQVPVLFSPDKTDATRELVYSVNGGPAQPVALAAVASPICVPVSEGDNMITGILSTISDQGVNLGSVNQTLNNVSISTLRLDAPANNATYTGADGGCSGVEAALEATADEIYPDGEPATITVEQDMNVVRTINAMVVGGKVEACVPLEDGSQTLRVTIPHTGATASVDVQASLMDPSSVVIDDVTVTLPPKDNPVATDNYRSTPPTVTWTLPMGTFFWDSYEIRCSDNELTEPDDETAWWDSAGAVSPQVFSVTPPTPMGLYDVLIGHRRHCVLRVCEAARGCSGLPQTSFEIYKPFRYQLVAPPNEVGLGMSGVGPDPSESPAHLGTNATPVGDVNGDGLEDILVAGSHLDAFTASSGTSDAFLYFGRDLAPSHSDTPSVDQPDIIFREAHPYNNYGLNLGNTLAGLGDINGDGRPDFAIGSAGHCDDCGAGGSKPSARAYGAVFVFFGRASDDPWDSGGGSNIFDLSTPCGADVCLYGDPAVVFHIFGAGLAGVGRFDSDALNDVAIGAPQAGAGEGELYVISGGSFVDLTVDNVADIGGCSASPCTRPGAVWGISRSLPADSADFTGYLLTGSVIDDGDGGTGSNDYSRMGALLTAVGDMDASQDGRMDLVTADTSSSTPKISLLAGREWSGLAGLQPLTVDDLSLIGTDRPNYVLAAVGNVYDPPGGNVGVPDLAFKDQASDTAIIYPGDVTLPEGFDDTKKITIQTFQTEGAESICGGEFPALGLVDFTDATPDRFLDIDEDGLADLCLGSARDDLAQPPGTAYLMYGSSIAGTAAGDNVALPLAVRITPPSAAADTELRTTQYVGDITGDGAPDLVVGDRPDRFDDDVVRDGALWILY